jgi:hypothetical protein
MLSPARMATARIPRQSTVRHTPMARRMYSVLNPDLGSVPTPPYGYTPPKVEPRYGIFIGIGNVVTPPYGHESSSQIVESRISSGQLGDVLTRIDNALFAGHNEWVDPNVMVTVEHDNTLTGTGSASDPLSVAIVDGGVF